MLVRVATKISESFWCDVELNGCNSLRLEQLRQFFTLPVDMLITGCYSNVSHSPHRRVVTPLLRAIGCVRWARRLDAYII